MVTLIGTITNTLEEVLQILNQLTRINISKVDFNDVSSVNSIK